MYKEIVIEKLVSKTLGASHITLHNFFCYNHRVCSCLADKIASTWIKNICNTSLQRFFVSRASFHV